jgi:ketosteroid isomerase-like protein
MNMASTTNTTGANRQRIREVMAELDKGNGQVFVDAMADDFSWTIPGDTPWSRTYSGKQVAIHELLRPLYAQFATPYASSTRRVMADGDMVIIEFDGRVTTKAGKAYNNRYCYVCRMEGGQMKDLMEYFDTALVSSALEAPSSPSPALAA